MRTKKLISFIPNDIKIYERFSILKNEKNLEQIMNQNFNIEGEN